MQSLRNRFDFVIRALAPAAVSAIFILCAGSTCIAAAETSAGLEQRVEKLLSQMTPEEKIDYIGGDRGFYIRPIPRLGLPEIKMSDGPVGTRNYGPSTQYPAGICMAATW